MEFGKIKLVTTTYFPSFGRKLYLNEVNSTENYRDLDIKVKKSGENNVVVRFSYSCRKLY